MVSSSIIETTGLKGYLSLPDTGTGKGLLLIHAWWGLNDFFKKLTDRFASEGFVTFTPDYYNGNVAKTIDEANDLSTNLDFEEADMTLSRAFDYLKKHPAIKGEKIGVLGVSLGTLFTINLARSSPDDVGAAIVFYGLGDQNPDNIKVPFQGHFSETDEWDADPEAVKEFEKELLEKSRTYEFHTYPGTTHWFLEEDVLEAYVQAAADQAFQRTVAFLKVHL